MKRGKAMKKRILFFLLLVIGITVWGYGIARSQWLSTHYQSVSVRFAKEGISEKLLKKALDNETQKGMYVPKILAWNEKESINATSFYSKQSEQVHLYEILGNSENLLPMTLVDGTYLSSDDRYGCILEEKIAYRLFGTVHAAGSKVIVEDKTYVVRGVVKVDDTVMIIPASEASLFLNLELFYNDVELGNNLAADFLLQNGLNNEHTILEGGFYSKLIIIFTLFPAWFFLIFAAKEYLGTLYIIMKQKKIKKMGLLYLFFGFAFIGGLVWFTEFRFYIPERLIPNQWSNLEFWSMKWEEFIRFFQEAAYWKPYPRDVIMMQGIKECILVTSIVSILVWIMHGHRKIIRKKVNGSVALSVSIIAAAVISCFILFYFGYEFDLPRYYPGVLIFYLIWTVENPSAKVLAMGFLVK